MITLKKHGSILHTLALPQRGSYKVRKHHKNGFITTEIEPNVIGRINIRTFYPYYMLLKDVFFKHTILTLIFRASRTMEEYAVSKNCDH